MEIDGLVINSQSFNHLPTTLSSMMIRFPLRLRRADPGWLKGSKYIGTNMWKIKLTKHFGLNLYITLCYPKSGRIPYTEVLAEVYASVDTTLLEVRLTHLYCMNLLRL